MCVHVKQRESTSIYHGYNCSIKVVWMSECFKQWTPHLEYNDISEYDLKRSSSELFFRKKEVEKELRQPAKIGW